VSPFPEDGEAEMTMEQSSDTVKTSTKKVMEIESRLLPCGLHVVAFFR
jgi:hypothetical protein